MAGQGHSSGAGAPPSTFRKLPLILAMTTAAIDPSVQRPEPHTRALSPSLPLVLHWAILSPYTYSAAAHPPCSRTTVLLLIYWETSGAHTLLGEYHPRGIHHLHLKRRQNYKDKILLNIRNQRNRHS
ncbi:hypothetical protein KIL84_003054 [Mauremys mutica]|uniref:Uncharacterized protein n=1 Tax=Mauremys mutica TaxID=74926 RepID=A0A9D3WTC9_9SAUR|nr:hypothetical protein KIL84_003054 [Mauremys mutica]